MQGYESDTYGDRWAEIYDPWVGQRLSEATTQATVELLAELSGGGSVLELAIGTGRVALPLAARGLAVHGIDASADMVAKLREKPGGAALPVTLGDFGEVGVAGTFDLIYVVFNTFFALPTQEAQVQCFANVARQLAPGGVFVMEAFVPDMGRYALDGQVTRALELTTDAVRLEATMHDAMAQTLQVQQITLTQEGVRLYPIFLRYAWPSELDLMARLAGLALRDRWGGWDRAPFTRSSTTHVSVYARPPA